MAKLPQVTGAELVRALQKTGFRIARRERGQRARDLVGGLFANGQGKLHGPGAVAQCRIAARG